MMSLADVLLDAGLVSSVVPSLKKSFKHRLHVALFVSTDDKHFSYRRETKDAYENKLANFQTCSPFKKVVAFECPWLLVSASKKSLKIAPRN